ncbi:MAG: redoxin domain-containing protein [Saprospiraceae bacterium]|nr:redoxin domain-containing protein [Saprospiraceae bacterium]
MVANNIKSSIFKEMITNEGKSVSELSKDRTVLLVFLRHFGCIFCREALADIAKRRKSIEEMGSIIVFVHMTDDTVAERYFNRYGLENALHISDPECKFYAQLGLVKGNFTQLFGLQSWIRGFSATVFEGIPVGLQQLGDGFQMPGVFAIKDDEIKESFIHKLASDRPDYENLLKDCCEVD